MTSELSSRLSVDTTDSPSTVALDSPGAALGASGAAGASATGVVVGVVVGTATAVCASRVESAPLSVRRATEDVVTEFNAMTSVEVPAATDDVVAVLLAFDPLVVEEVGGEATVVDVVEVEDVVVVV